ncbi:FtsX-like permease family protein [Alteromonas sp. C1M14]|uniref:ABC transporter permease n=1 Tax=Alteromonas sp. C1M14 TaxID=2841567 RepID=UPI001C0854A3|nr:FtsX-like permease family protein [Alteromonas sp. C1M14]MBU2979544.1 FtsX-like permease family protein [Alteromonas sp. C1M14]
MLDIKPILSALRRSKVGAILLLLQVALTTAIVSNAIFMISQNLSYLREDTGYPQQEIFSFVVMTFGKDIDLDQQAELDETMIRNIPGVVNSTLSQAIPLSGGGSSASVRLKPLPETSKEGHLAYFYGDENALETFGVKLIEGRNFRPEEVIFSNNFQDNGPTTIIVSKALAQSMFDKGAALGEFIYVEGRALEIIGIVDVMESAWPRADDSGTTGIIPFIHAQNYQHFLVRTEASERANVMNIIEEKMLQAYNKRVIINVEGLDESKDAYDSSDVLMMRMLIVLVVVLILVTALGILGLTQFNISKRTKQIGTRRALGARKSAIVRYFLVENALVCAVGLVIGSFGAVFLGKALMQAYSIDALTLNYVIFTAFFIFVMSLLAVVVPARRAASISPSIATRSI